MAEFKCNTCKFYKGGSRCECCFENEHYEEDKYRWHNLRRNSEDLPTEKGMYWVCVEGFDTKYTSTYWDGYVWWGYSVIGWKEIEPFEEVGE